jgi:hypothetical protein
MRKVLVVELALKTSCSGRGLLVFDASTRSLGTPPRALHTSLLVPAAFQKYIGTVAGFPSDDIFNREAELYEWQPWRSRFLVSIHREEEFYPLLSSGDKFWVAL